MKEIMFNLGGAEIAIILIVALLVLGPKQLPGIAKQIGKMMRDFRSMSSDMTRALDLDGHNDYDHAPNRGSSFDYGYNHAAIEPSETKFLPTDVAASEFAYTAPVAGTTVAAIDDRPKSDDTITEHGGARVYEEPTTDTTETPGDIHAPIHTNEGTKL